MYIYIYILYYSTYTGIRYIYIDNDIYKVVPPPVISWFLNHGKYRYITYKP